MNAGDTQVGTAIAVPEVAMKNLHLVPALISSIVLVSACATGHTAMRGSVVMKVTDTDAHVCLAEGEAHVGDHVRLYKHICNSSGKRTTCEKVAVADGEVTGLISEHYSTVRFPAGTTFAEGYTVEPLQ